MMLRLAKWAHPRSVPLHSALAVQSKETKEERKQAKVVLGGDLADARFERGLRNLVDAFPEI
jgi:hypothetical protein